MQDLILLVKNRKKGISSIAGSGIILRDNEIKDNINVIKPLENKGILLKGTTSKIATQKERFLNSAGLPLIKNVLVPLAKSILIPLGLTAAGSATEAAIQKKIYGPGTTVLLISNEEKEIMKIVKSLEESGLLIKGISKTVGDEAKQKMWISSNVIR